VKKKNWRRQEAWPSGRAHYQPSAQWLQHCSSSHRPRCAFPHGLLLHLLALILRKLCRRVTASFSSNSLRAWDKSRSRFSTGRARIISKSTPLHSFDLVGRSDSREESKDVQSGGGVWKIDGRRPWLVYRGDLGVRRRGCVKWNGERKGKLKRKGMRVWVRVVRLPG
jgi:hypothetical protein